MDADHALVDVLTSKDIENELQELEENI